MNGQPLKPWLAPLALIGLLAVMGFVLPAYHHNNMARILVLAVFAMGYNIAFGYTGLLSLGHALFFGAGLYAAGLAINQGGVTAGLALGLGLLAGGGVALATGVLALRTAGVSFMIVTLMFAQAGYLLLLYFGAFTGGDEGFVVARTGRVLGGFDLTTDGPRYGLALGLFTLAILGQTAIVRAPFGRVMVAMRENSARAQMLGFDPFRTKLIVLVISGLYSGVAGAAYGILFGYVGASFAGIQYSILPLLWVLLGGSGTVLGPFLGVFIMFYLIDLSSSYTSAHLMVVGVALLVLVLFAPRGILGGLRKRWGTWLA
jgi:branched-chain amino acid transport system permease protein